MYYSYLNFLHLALKYKNHKQKPPKSASKNSYSISNDEKYNLHNLCMTQFSCVSIFSERNEGTKSRQHWERNRQHLKCKLIVINTCSLNDFKKFKLFFKIMKIQARVQIFMRIKASFFVKYSTT